MYCITYSGRKESTDICTCTVSHPANISSEHAANKLDNRAEDQTAVEHPEVQIWEVYAHYICTVLSTLQYRYRYEVRFESQDRNPRIYCILQQQNVMRDNRHNATQYRIVGIFVRNAVPPRPVVVPHHLCSSSLNMDKDLSPRLPTLHPLLLPLHLSRGPYSVPGFPSRALINKRVQGTCTPILRNEPVSRPSNSFPRQRSIQTP